MSSRSDRVTVNMTSCQDRQKDDRQRDKRKRWRGEGEGSREGRKERRQGGRKERERGKFRSVESTVNRLSEVFNCTMLCHSPMYELLVSRTLIGEIL